MLTLYELLIAVETYSTDIIMVHRLLFLQVLFKMFEGYIDIGQENIIAVDIVNGIVSFLVVALGALFIGLVFGYAGAFITKYTTRNRIIEPTFVFIFCYVSYLSAEVFHLSGILA